MNIQKYYQRCDFRESGSVVAEVEVFACIRRVDW
jgi:hypothetical protein